MRMWNRLLPRPVLALVLAIIWVGVNRSLSPGHVLLGFVLGALAAWLAAHAAPSDAGRPRLPHIGRMLPFLLLVGWDILIANLRVAALILGPMRRIRSGFVEVPLDVTRDVAIHVLASIITLTPGTVSLCISDDRRRLLVHYLNSEDPAALVREIKTRYERRIQEIFEC